MKEQEQTALWRAVIEKAARDAYLNLPPKTVKRKDRGLEINSFYYTQLAARDDANKWFARMGRDFMTVCSLADIDPFYLNEKYKCGLLKEVVDAGWCARQTRDDWITNVPAKKETSKTGRNKVIRLA